MNAWGRWGRVLVALGSVGCGSGGSGSGDTDEGPCLQPLETRALAWSERSPLGFSADEVLGTVGAERRGRLTYQDGRMTTLSLELARGSGAVEYEVFTLDAASSDSAPSSGDGGCPDRVSIPATLAFETGDGAFAEAWTVSLFAERATAASSGSASYTLDSLNGSYAPAGVAPGEQDAITVQLNVELTAERWSGTLAVFEGPAPSSERAGARRDDPIDQATF